MDIIMLAILILAIAIAVPIIIYLWIKWYYYELDRLINYKYDTLVSYLVINSFTTVASFGACVCASWLILIHKGGDYLITQIFILVSCIIMDIILIASGISIAGEEDEFKEYRNSFIYIIQFILIIPISMYLVLTNFIKSKPKDLSNKEIKSVAEQLNEDIDKW